MPTRNAVTPNAPMCVIADSARLARTSNQPPRLGRDMASVEAYAAVAIHTSPTDALSMLIPRMTGAEATVIIATAAHPASAWRRPPDQ
jgi:hypothetical protein